MGLQIRDIVPRKQIEIKDLKGKIVCIDAYNIIEALDSAKEYLTRYGGHKKAAGLSLEIEHLSNLYDKLLEVAESKLKDEELVPKITVDAKVDFNAIDLELLKKIQQFEPFGLGNPRPVFMMENAGVSSVRTVGKENKHLKMKIGAIDAIGFDLGHFAAKINAGDKSDLAFTLDEDTWTGEKKLQLKILDLK